MFGDSNIFCYIIFIIKVINKIMVTFDREQKSALEKGGFLREQLTVFAKEACDTTTVRNKRHAYICGTGGAGKSHSVKTAAEESGVPYHVIKGQSSLFGMAQNLAVLKVKHGDDPVIVIIDDCDKLFADSDSMNTMKALLEDGWDSGTFTYSKNLHLNTIPEGAKRDAVEVFMNDDESGFQIDCSNFFFIVTSNQSLPSLQEVEEIRKKNKGIRTSKQQKIDDLHAIRTRVRYNLVDCNREEMWGSIAHVLLNDNVLTNRSKEETMFILDWMWNHRNQMNEFNVRTTLDMSDAIDQVGIEDVKDRWAYNFID
jgi:hypothetical protein